MKKMLLPRVMITSLLLIFSLIVFAQDTTRTVVNTSSTSTVPADEALWYMQPWVWIVGGVALLLLLIALFSGGRSKSRTDRVIITKTVRSESDPE